MRAGRKMKRDCPDEDGLNDGEECGGKLEATLGKKTICMG